MIVVTGASGHLGRLVVNNLVKRIPAKDVIAAVRTPGKVGELAALGVQVREADYDRPKTLAGAFEGAEKVLLISSSEVGKRATQHRTAIDSARRAGVKLIAYTSILHADTSPLELAGEHKATEDYLKGSGVPHVVLRNGWYTENYTASIPPSLQYGVFLGSAGEGKISSAARADFAEAAAAVLLGENQAGRVYELAGDAAYTLADLAAEISRQAGKPVAYQDLPEKEFEAVLLKAGLPPWLAHLLAESDTGASKGGLLDGSGALRQLIGRPTTPLADSVAEALRG
jgi:NAD(P)H dehydrogenase (quinone)